MNKIMGINNNVMDDIKKEIMNELKNRSKKQNNEKQNNEKQNNEKQNNQKQKQDDNMLQPIKLERAKAIYYN